MPNRWVFELGFIELCIACLIYISVLRLQLRAFKIKTALQPLKILLLNSVIFLILVSLPLMFVYANILWFHSTAQWIVYTAVIANATGKVIVSCLLYLIYKFNIEGH